MSYQDMTPYGKLRAAMAQCESSVRWAMRIGNEQYDESGGRLTPAWSGAQVLKGFLRSKRVSRPDRWRRCLSVATRFYQRELIRLEAAEKDAAGVPRNMPGLPGPIPTYV
jgi:hypothetical protein